MATIFTALIAAASAAKPVSTPSVRELSDAVASVNDWRALGIFAFAFMLVLLGLVVWLVVSLVRSNKPVIETIIPVRLAMEAAKDAVQAMRSDLVGLIHQVATLTSAVERNGGQASEAVDKLDELTRRLDRLERDKPS